MCFIQGTYLGNVGLRGQADHDVQFLQLHVDWVVILDKEYFNLLLQDLRPAKTYTLDPVGKLLVLNIAYKYGLLFNKNSSFSTVGQIFTFESI